MTTARVHVKRPETPRAGASPHAVFTVLRIQDLTEIERSVFLKLVWLM